MKFMNITEEKVNEEHKTRKSGLFLTVLLFMMIIGIAFFAYMKSRDEISFKDINLKGLLSADSAKSRKAEAEKTYEIAYEPREHPVFNVHNEYLVKCTKDAVKGLNKKGQEIWSINASFNNPLVKSNGVELMIADLGGRDLYVIRDKTVKWNNRIDNSIINADIGKGGYVAVVQQAKGYKGMIKVFDPLGVEMFYRKIADYFVLGVQVAPSSEQLVMNSVDTSGINIKPSLQFFDMLGNPFAAKEPVKDVIFPSVWYLNDDSLLAVSDSLLVFYDKERNEKWRKEFSRIYSSNVVLGKYLVIAVESENKPGMLGGASSEILFFNSKGNKTAACEVEAGVRNLRVCSDIIAVNTGREVYFIDTKGKLIGKYSSKHEILDVYFFSKAEAAVVTKSSVVVTQLN